MMILEEFDPTVSAVINPDMVVERIENFPEVTGGLLFGKAVPEGAGFL